ncbi:hypothetical protein AB6D11_18740 [Vibrio splendidus]
MTVTKRNPDVPYDHKDNATHILIPGEDFEGDPSFLGTERYAFLDKGQFRFCRPHLSTAVVGKTGWVIKKEL